MDLPLLQTDVPGPASCALAERLALVEGRNVTFLGTVPLFWEKGLGANVWDVDGNRFVDLTAAFAVSGVGHAHPKVVEAVQTQARTLIHGMGDVHPSGVKVELLEKLVSLFPGGGEARAVLGSSGSDAVETALKTAQLATGNSGVVAFEGAYHGLGFGALDTTARPMFREAFAARLPRATSFARFGDLDDVQRAADECAQPVGAIILEPIQGRGGEQIPPEGFLAGLRELCDARGWLFIADEIYTGFGRTGRWFACDHEGVVPDLLCVAKAMASGMPISACIGKRSVMDAWPLSEGEALHTQTFLGHPPGCAAALAAIAVIEEEELVERCAETGRSALEHLTQRLAGKAAVTEVRGRGLMIGIELREPGAAAQLCTEALTRGVIALPSGDDGRVVGISPPLTIEPSLLLDALDRLTEGLQ